MCSIQLSYGGNVLVSVSNGVEEPVCSRAVDTADSGRFGYRIPATYSLSSD